MDPIVEHKQVRNRRVRSQDAQKEVSLTYVLYSRGLFGAQ
jgi:hypothetical protein